MFSHNEPYDTLIEIVLIYLYGRGGEVIKIKIGVEQRYSTELTVCDIVGP